ncbi:hypothetical protein [Nocardia asiatica]|uniref:hypothetical protein n=1 Tax=Nocardia asiatica TaxID=209252 RepID=UPI002456E27F|nr:hypothetical protein [Nocardia asiatica]
MTGDQTTSPRVVATDSYRTIDNPSETQLHDILADMNLSVPFVIVDRLDGPEPGDYYIQVHLDDQVDPDRGRGYIVEFRDGGPHAHFHAAIRDDAPWGSVFSPAFDTVVKTVQDWAFQREGWRTALAWERLEFRS